MSKPSTNMEVQRATFVESLHNSLKKQASKAIAEHNRLTVLAKSYIEDGLDEGECVELLMIDGLGREAAESYISMVTSEVQDSNDKMHEYSFTFEDLSGRVYSSYDVNKIVRASDEDDAWTKAEEMLDSEIEIESQRLLSVNRIG